MFGRGVRPRVGLGTVLFACALGLSSGQAVQPAGPPTVDQSGAANAPAPPKTPGEIYKEAMHPLDVVRTSLDNWSDAELGALAVGVRKAGEACAQGKPEDYSGDDLYDYARLCSLGQNWGEANNAATRYVDSHAEPHRAQAYALTMNALVHLGSKPLAYQTAIVMLEALPYDAEVAYAIRYLKDVLEREGDTEAIALATTEHPAIVAALKKGVALTAVHGDAVMSVGALYESAMEKAFWERFDGSDGNAATTVSDCDAALANGAALPDDDQQLIGSVRTQYGLLGAHLPAIKVTRSLQGEKAKAQIDSNYGQTTVLVLFPDWCTQCRTIMKPLTAFALANGRTPIHAYGLMFAEDAGSAATTSHEDAAKDVQGTATLLVAPETAKTLGAVDYPLALVVDHVGTVRYVGVIPGNAFDGNGYMERVLTRMATARETPKGPANEK